MIAQRKPFFSADKHQSSNVGSIKIKGLKAARLKLDMHRREVVLAGTCKYLIVNVAQLQKHMTLDSQT